VDLVVANDHIPEDLPEGVQAVDPSLDKNLSCPLYTADLVDLSQPTRHDSEKLAEALIALLEEHTGPLEWFTNGELTSSQDGAYKLY
jgi:hypothetical protein